MKTNDKYFDFVKSLRDIYSDIFMLEEDIRKIDEFCSSKQDFRIEIIPLGFEPHNKIYISANEYDLLSLKKALESKLEIKKIELEELKKHIKL